MNNITTINTVLIAIFKKIVNYLGIFSSRFITDNCLHIAAALTFTSLLALVPLLAISVSIIKQIPIAQEYLNIGQEYLFQIFVPEFGDEVQSYLLAFVNKTQSLTSIGIVFVAITALLTLDTIEKTLNKIWQVKKSRNVFMRFSIYFIILTLGPVLIGISLSVTTYLSTLTFYSDAVSIAEIRFNFLNLVPIITTTFAFTLVYKIVPNVKVPLHHAFLGGFVAALLFEFAKAGFASFITSFSSYQLIYGALAAIPLTLIWIYVSWLVILIGAELTASGADFLSLKLIPKQQSRVDLCLAIKLLGDIGFLSNNDGISSNDLMISETHIPDAQILGILEQLEQRELIMQSESLWHLAKEKSHYCIQELLSISNPCCSEYALQSDFESDYNKNIQKALVLLHLELSNSEPILLQNIYN